VNRNSADHFEALAFVDLFVLLFVLVAAEGFAAFFFAEDEAAGLFFVEADLPFVEADLPFVEAVVLFFVDAAFPFDVLAEEGVFTPTASTAEEAAPTTAPVAAPEMRSTTTSFVLS
jgi:hypothetical protein